MAHSDEINLIEGKLSVHVSEFNQIRTEILRRLDFQFRIKHYALILMVAAMQMK